MSAWRKLKYLLPWVRRAEERDIDDELRALEALAPRHALGNLTVAAEDARSALGWLWLERLGQDLRYAGRAMRHHKTFTLLVVVSLGLGIGANTAIFSFTESVLLRPLPVRDPEALVVMKWRAQGYAMASRGMSWSTGGSSVDPAGGVFASIFPYPALGVFESSTDVLSGAFAYFTYNRLSVATTQATDSVKAHYVSGGYFPGMGVRPAAGRLIQPGDDATGAGPVVVLSHEFSRRRFGDSHAAVSQTIRINDKPFTIIGVAPSEFFGAEPGSPPDLFLPLHALAVVEAPGWTGVWTDEHFYWIEIMGRLREGVSIAQAQTTLAHRFQQFAAGTATSEAQRRDLPRLTVVEGAAGLDSLRRQYAPALLVLAAMVGVILLIACSNIANLLLARTASRRREMAVRLGIGASRARLVRQLLTESVLLATLGGALGLALAWWGIDVLTALLAGGRDHFTLHAAINWRVLGATAAIAAATGLVFGLAPALQSTRVDVVSALKDVRAGEAVSRTRRFGLASGLVATQIALSVVLLVAAGLFGRTLAKLHAIDVGFNRDQILLVTLRPAAVGYRGATLPALFEDVRERLSRLPGVQAVSLSSRPFPTGGGTLAAMSVDGVAPPVPDAGSQARRSVFLASVGPAFFETMQIPMVAGRGLTDQDRLGAAPVVVVNRLFTAQFGLESPIGRTLVFSDARFEIVGVVDDALALALREDKRAIAYFPYLQARNPPTQMTYEIRTSGDPLDQAGAVREVVRQVDDRLAIHDVTTQAVHVDQAISREITLARLGSLLASLALVIACVGVYGTVAFTVARRTIEIGIRMALGAQSRRIVWLVVRDVLLVTAAGLAAGLVLSLIGSRYVTTLLYEVGPYDPVSLAMAVGILMASGALAALLPARRASRIDPMTAVRQE